MYDTVKIRSPRLETRLENQVRNALVTRSAVRRSSGEIVYELTSDSLIGSWDNRLSVLLKEEVLTVDLPRPGASSLGLSDTAYSIILECSVHKAMAGHNITGGPQCLAAALYWLVDTLGDLLGCVLPAAGSWRVLRVDVADCYQLPKLAIEEYLTDMRLKKFKRRKPSVYPTSIMWAGDRTAFKIYMKGPEFKRHDAKVLTPLLGESEVSALQLQANGIMRVETSIKAREIKERFGSYPDVDSLWHADGVFQTIHQEQVDKVIAEGTDVEQVRLARDVKARLFERYSKRLAVTLYGVWCDLATIGQEEVKQGLSSSAYYRYIGNLRDAGISWTGSDVVTRERHVPVGFTIADPARWADREMLPAVAEAQRQYALAS